MNYQEENVNLSLLNCKLSTLMNYQEENINFSQLQIVHTYELPRRKCQLFTLKANLHVAIIERAAVSD